MLGRPVGRVTLIRRTASARACVIARGTAGEESIGGRGNSFARRMRLAYFALRIFQQQRTL